MVMKPIWNHEIVLRDREWREHNYTERGEEMVAEAWRKTISIFRESTGDWNIRIISIVTYADN